MPAVPPPSDGPSPDPIQIHIETLPYRGIGRAKRRSVCESTCLVSRRGAEIMTIAAKYENGVLEPLDVVDINEGPQLKKPTRAAPGRFAVPPSAFR